MMSPLLVVDFAMEAGRVMAGYDGLCLSPCAERGIDVEAARKIGDIVAGRWHIAGRRACGRKIGLTSEALRVRLAAPHQTEGLLFDDMRVAEDGRLQRSSLIQPLVEPEIAIVLDTDLGGDEEPGEFSAAIGKVAAAIEVADSRIDGWRIGYADALMDNGSAARFALSNATAAWQDVSGACWTILRNGVAIEGGQGLVEQTTIMHDLRWLAKEAALRNRPLRRGEVILTGALFPPIAVDRGDRFEVTVEGVGTTRVHFMEDMA